MTSGAEALMGRCVTSEAKICTPMALPARVARRFDAGDVPVAIRCIAGSVWITQEGDRCDYVLEAGERFTASGPGDLVIFAFEDSNLVVSSPSIRRDSAA